MKRKLEIDEIEAMESRRPAFKGQTVIARTNSSDPIVTKIDEVNEVGLFQNILNPSDLEEYASEAMKVIRISGKSAYNSDKPRRELCYTPSGDVFSYSNKNHDTTIYPPHVLKIIPKLLLPVKKYFPNNEYWTLSHARDILYDNSFVGGGSVGAHSDIYDNHRIAPTKSYTETKLVSAKSSDSVDSVDAVTDKNVLSSSNDETSSLNNSSSRTSSSCSDCWGIVIIFSLGQTRWLRIRSKKHKSQWINVEMSHNSLLVMSGESFQQRYTHQVDKLTKHDIVGNRLSLNVRFTKGDPNNSA